MPQYKIGLYDENRNLIGYKADSFWSLSKSHFKPHGLSNGKIPDNLIRNLTSILNVGESKDIVSGLRRVNKHYFFGNFETMLIGFSDVDGGSVTFTHRVFHDSIEELSPAEAGSVSGTTSTEGASSPA